MTNSLTLIMSLHIRVIKLWPEGQVWPATCFSIAWVLRLVFIFINDWKTNQRNSISWHIKIIWPSHFSVHKVWLVPSFMWLASSFYVQWRKWVALSRTLCPAKQKIFTMWKSLLLPVPNKAIWEGELNPSVKWVDIEKWLQWNGLGYKPSFTCDVISSAASCISGGN